MRPRRGQHEQEDDRRRDPRFNEAAANSPRRGLPASVPARLLEGFNEAAANSPRRGQDEQTLFHLPDASMRPRRIRHGEASRRTRKRRLMCRFNEAAANSPRRGPQGATSSARAAGFNEAAANSPRRDTSMNHYGNESPHASMRPRRIRHGERRHCVAEWRDVAGFNEAAANSPRRGRRYPCSMSPTRRFNEAAANSPRRAPQQLRRQHRQHGFNEAAANSPRRDTCIYDLP